MPSGAVHSLGWFGVGAWGTASLVCPLWLCLPQAGRGMKNRGDLGSLEQCCWYLLRCREENLASCLLLRAGFTPSPS